MVEDIENILKDFGKNMRAIRQAKKLTLLVVEINTGIDESDLSKIERGEINISLINMGKIANALEVKLAELVTFK